MKSGLLLVTTTLLISLVSSSYSFPYQENGGSKKLKSFGYNWSAYDTNQYFGVSAQFNQDFGLGYNWIFGSVGEYLLMNPKLFAILGGRQVFDFKLFLI